MEKLLDKVILRDAFSAAASGYDSSAWLQQKFCSRMLARIIRNYPNSERILDVGMGTGALMQNLNGHYQGASVFGIDLAFGMSRLAKERGLKVLQAEAEALPFRNDYFDLVVSSFVYQWVFDLSIAFYEANRVLRKKGNLCFIFFGKDTLRELKFSFSHLKSNRFNDRLHDAFPLVDAEGVVSLLKSNRFKKIKTNTYPVTEYFSDLFSLVNWLKSIGANRLTRPRIMGKEIWQEASDIYAKNFKEGNRIAATFQVIEVEAQK